MNSDEMQAHNILFQRYYNTDSKPMISDKFTSSHWKDFSDKIKVESTVINGKEDYDLTGYGFGENREGNLFNKIFNPDLYSENTFFLILSFYHHYLIKSP